MIILFRALMHCHKKRRIGLQVSTRRGGVSNDQNTIEMSSNNAYATIHVQHSPKQNPLFTQDDDKIYDQPFQD